MTKMACVLFPIAIGMADLSADAQAGAAAGRHAEQMKQRMLSPFQKT
jgi:hypothetical protein